MAEKRVFIATVGPYHYDTTEDLDEYEGVFANRKQHAIITDGKILLAGGGDLVLEGSNSNPSRIRFVKGIESTDEIILALDGTNKVLSVCSDTAAEGRLFIGYDQQINSKPLQDFNLSIAGNEIYFRVFDSVSENYAVTVTIAYPTSQNAGYEFNENRLKCNVDKAQDLGGASTAWDDVYADDFQNVADFLFLDSKDDLAVLEGIKGSGKIDKRTGIEMIDDDTLPEWMKSKDKKDGRILLDPEGKPYLSMKMVTSLVMGACRQLNRKVANLQQQLDAVVKNLQQDGGNA